MTRRRLQPVELLSWSTYDIDPKSDVSITSTMFEPAEETAPPSEASSNPLESYANYPFASDETYQQGLASLIAGGALEGNPTSEVKDEILRRTRVFYFNRVTGHSISMDEAREYEFSLRATNQEPEDDSTAHSSKEPTANSDETRVLTFAELQELIESGKVDQIPNNKVIPERLNDAPPSQSTAPARKKPWELAAVAT
ncbi:hypothetical protein D9615_003380 [Tricholomella constricta]|uniref:Uncharacterized protein n=1 Tax=Tricholomella constricta TaxID=117010 RepID=A0A8H5HJA4_9AGAR|nr:hypothetical protein D9615_003380 [Tricholomella constricta]